MLKLFFSVHFLKMGNIKEDVVNELHKPARIHFKRRRVIVKGLNDLLQADLVEMIPYAKINKDYKYILVVINVFSKFVWCEPVKNKSGKEVTKAMEKILSQMKVTVKNLHTDMGTEFYNKDFKQLLEKWKINHYSTYSNLKASIVERVNRTLKHQMWKQFSLQGNYKWLHILQTIVTTYNNTKHRTTGMKPSAVKKKDEKYLLEHAYNHLKTIDPRKQKFKEGDYVRISKYREAFSKGYTPNWSNEVFKIRKVHQTNPTTYYLEDQEGSEIKGGFYEQELQKVKYPDVYLVEKILKRKGNKLYVKWLGLNKNSWISKSEIV